MTRAVAALERLVDERRATRAEWLVLARYRRQRARAAGDPFAALRLTLLEFHTAHVVAGLLVMRAFRDVARSRSAAT